jgi:hypothetical protein
VPVRFYCGAADEPTERTLRRQAMEVQQLSLALGEAAAEDLAFRLAVETGEAGRVERVVFLALRGEDRVECFWPVPLELPVGVGAAVQLRLMADEGQCRAWQGRQAADAPAHSLASPEGCRWPTSVPGHAAVAESRYLMSTHLTCLNPAQRSAPPQLSAVKIATTYSFLDAAGPTNPSQRQLATSRPIRTRRGGDFSRDCPQAERGLWQD